MKEIDFPALFDEVMSEYPDGVPMATDKRAPFHYVFALDVAINKGDFEPLNELLNEKINPPNVCLPYLVEAYARNKSLKKDPYPTSKTPGRPKGGAGRPRKSKLTDSQRFVVVLTMASRDQRQIIGYGDPAVITADWIDSRDQRETLGYSDCIKELATRFGVSESTIREIWDNRKSYFPMLTL